MSAFAVVERVRGWLMPPPFWIKSTGKKGEYLARRALHRLGYHLVEQNWRTGKLELDLIMANADHLLIVEVKTRKQDHGRFWRDLIHPKQEKRLETAAQIFLKSFPEPIPTRFLLIVVNLNSKEIQFVPMSEQEGYLPRIGKSTRTKEP